MLHCILSVEERHIQFVILTDATLAVGDSVFFGVGVSVFRNTFY